MAGKVKLVSKYCNVHHKLHYILALMGVEQNSLELGIRHHTLCKMNVGKILMRKKITLIQNFVILQFYWFPNFGAEKSQSM